MWLVTGSLEPHIIARGGLLVAAGLMLGPFTQPLRKEQEPHQGPIQASTSANAVALSLSQAPALSSLVRCLFSKRPALAWPRCASPPWLRISTRTDALHPVVHFRRNVAAPAPNVFTS